MPVDWSLVVTEGGRGILFLGVTFYLWRIGKRRDLADQPGWSAILWGFWLLVVQAAAILTTQHPALDWEGSVGTVSIRELLYNTALPMAGAGLVLYGFSRFLVYPAKLDQAQTQLEEANRTLEARVAEATADLTATNHALARERASLGLFRDLLDRSNDAIFIMEPEEGRFTDVNQTACDRLGYTREELLGLTKREIQTRLEGQEDWRVHATHLEQVGQLTREGHHRCKDGSEIPVEVTLQHLTQDGEAYVVAIARDISERNRALEEARANLDMLETLFEASPEPIIAVDPVGRVQLWNPAAETVFGWDAEAVAGQVLPNVPEGDPTLKEALARARDGEPFQAQAVPRRSRNGEIRYYNVSVAPLVGDGGGSVGSIAVLSDVTAQLEVEAAKRRALETEAEVEHLREIDRFKTRFLNTAAHELATPLTPVRFQISALASGMLGELDPGQAEAVEMLERNVQRFQHLVEDLLDSTRLQGGKLKIDPRMADLSGLLEQLASDMAPLMADKDLTFESDISPDLCAWMDPIRIGQVVTNLLDNARKYTPAGGSVQLAAGQGGGRVRVEVTDDGLGLEEATADTVFDAFVQLHETAEQPQAGTGLGLYIAKAIVEQHGGTMDVESPGPGQGSTFWFELPVDPPGSDGDGQIGPPGRDAALSSA